MINVKDKKEKVVPITKPYDTPGKPYKEKDKGIAISMVEPLYLVMMEEGYMSWEEYAELVPPELRPPMYRYGPRKLKKYGKKVKPLNTK